MPVANLEDSSACQRVVSTTIADKVTPPAREGRHIVRFGRKNTRLLPCGIEGDALDRVTVVVQCAVRPAMRTVGLPKWDRVACCLASIDYVTIAFLLMHTVALSGHVTDRVNLAQSKKESLATRFTPFYGPYYSDIRCAKDEPDIYR